MKRFQFRFETVLRMKKIAEEVIQTQLADIKRRVRETIDSLTQCVSNIAYTERAFLSQLQGKVPMFQLSWYISYLGALKQEAVTHENHIRYLENEADKVRESLVKASQEKKIFENIKEKDHQKHITLLSREEQKILDEITVTHHNRKK